MVVEKPDDQTKMGPPYNVRSWKVVLLVVVVFIFAGVVFLMEYGLLMVAASMTSWIVGMIGGSSPISVFWRRATAGLCFFIFAMPAVGVLLVAVRLVIEWMTPTMNQWLYGVEDLENDSSADSATNR